MEDEKTKEEAEAHIDYDKALLASELAITTVNKSANPRRTLFWTCTQLMYSLLREVDKKEEREEFKMMIEDTVDTLIAKLESGEQE